MIKFKYLILTVFGGSLLPVRSLLADGDDPVSSFPNPLRSDIGSFPKLLEVIVNDIVIPIGAVVVVLAIIFSGFLYVKAQGNPEGLKKAHQAFIWTAVGALVVLGSWAITQTICTTVDNIRGPDSNVCGDVGAGS